MSFKLITSESAGVGKFMAIQLALIENNTIAENSEGLNIYNFSALLRDPYGRAFLPSQKRYSGLKNGTCNCPLCLGLAS
jgi:hypothetical protein